MASVSVSSLVLFIAALSISAAVAGTIAGTVSDVSESIDQRGLDVSESIESDVEVISDSGSDAVYDGEAGEVTLLVKNTGVRTLSDAPGSIDVLVDGRYASNARAEVVGGGRWREGAVLRLVVPRALDAGEHRAVVRVDGDEEVFRFVV